MEVLRRSSVFAADFMDAFDRSPTDKELVAQAKALGREFVHARLLRAGLAWSAPERAAPAPGGRLAEVCAVLLRLGDELELMRPSVYRNVARQLNLSLQSETVVTDAFLAVAAQIFSAGLSCRHHVGQGGVPVCCGCGAGRGLCTALAARHGARAGGLPGGVRAQDPGQLAAEAWRMDRCPQVRGQQRHRPPLPLAGGRTLQLRPLPEGHPLPAAAGKMNCLAGRQACPRPPYTPNPGKPCPLENVAPAPCWAWPSPRRPTLLLVGAVLVPCHRQTEVLWKG
ncbi:bcl-2-related ovarian killer protein isoform X1 [Tamandua tetradactyla]|uniref:bcl-2-related ovarian killer protein isoform X1 n=1 Tax=Tamandua tetradactyla TaxID=48850 RepID=UPI00405381F7